MMHAPISLLPWLWWSEVISDQDGEVVTPPSSVPLDLHQVLHGGHTHTH